MENFEQKIQMAKDILMKLQEQDLSLKDGIDLYKAGIKELKEAQEMLESAKQTYSEIKNNEI